MEPKIEDGVLVVVDVDTTPKYAKPSYIRAASIDGVRHRDDSTCWIDYGPHVFVARGSAATVRALVWPRKADRLTISIGPWEQDDDAGWMRQYEDFDVDVARVRELYHGCWSWECGLGDDGHGSCATLAEAKAAVDAVLTAAGALP